jgi:methylated-DNA-[protein]-cysteine S-methyltransferase
MLISTHYGPPPGVPIDTVKLVASDVGLRAVLWANDLDGSRAKDRVQLGDIIEGTNPVLEAARVQLDEYFTGTRRVFTLPLDPKGTEFQVEVWHALADVPYGETTTYGKQAANLGRPRAVRAVASANGRNPLSIVLPCHRIIGADGSLTGFAAGLAAKRWLLDHEARFANGAERLPGM